MRLRLSLSLVPRNRRICFAKSITTLSLSLSLFLIVIKICQLKVSRSRATDPNSLEREAKTLDRWQGLWGEFFLINSINIR